MCKNGRYKWPILCLHDSVIFWARSPTQIGVKRIMLFLQQTPWMHTCQHYHGGGYLSTYDVSFKTQTTQELGMIGWREVVLVSIFKSHISLVFFLIVLLKYNWHTINLTCLKCILWEVLTYVYTQRTMTTIKTVNISTTTEYLTPGGETAYMLSGNENQFAFPKILYKWSDTICTSFSSLLSLSIIILRFIHVVACINS